MKLTELKNYVFLWGKEGEGQVATVLGYGAMFNHSYTPNAYYIENEKQMTVDFYAIMDIDKGDEVFTNYNGEEDDRSPLTYDWYSDKLQPTDEEYNEWLMDTGKIKPMINIKLPSKKKKKK